MFYTYLWVAFIVELFVGIMLGWFIAQLYFKRKEALDIVLTPQGKDFSQNMSSGSAVSGKASIVQALAQDRSSIQMRSQQLEKSLAETAMLYEKANGELQSTRSALAQSEETRLNLDLQIQRLGVELAEKEAKNAALLVQMNNFQRAAADAQILINTLNEKTLRLQSDLDEALKTRDRQNTQLSIYKEKMRVAIAQLERTENIKKMDAPAA